MDKMGARIFIKLNIWASLLEGTVKREREREWEKTEGLGSRSIWSPAQLAS